MADSGVEGTTLEFTPSWVVAVVCFTIVLISLAVDRFLLCVGQLLQKSKWKTLVGAFRKIKEELMLLGFISLLLAVSQTVTEKICIPERLANVWLPCKKSDSSSTTARFTNFFWSSETRGRRLLTEASASTDFCAEKGKVPLLKAEALHHLDIFIFVLATFHVILCVVKIVLGYEKINQWNNDHDVGSNPYDELQCKLQKEKRSCLASISYEWKTLGWMVIVSFSFFKQFYPSVTKFEYLALHLNYMTRELRKQREDSQRSPQARESHQPVKDFHNYIIDAVRKDYEKIVGISWYLWIFAVIFLLVNVAGWHAYFWISFIPLTLLLIAGTILEHMITRLAEEVAQKHSDEERRRSGKSEEDLDVKFPVVKFPNCYFWFRRHQFVLHLIHIVLFENSLELIFFFFVLFQYDFHSCIMGKVGFVVPRIVIGVFVQLMCIYRTLPLYAYEIADETNDSGEEEDMWIVTKIWAWHERRKSSELATHESAKNGSRDRSAGTTEQMKVDEVELETKADIEAQEHQT